MSVPTSFLKKMSRPALLASYLLTVTLTLPGCDLFRNELKIDRAGNKEVQDYRDSLAPRLPLPTAKADDKSAMAGIPSLQNYVAPPNENLKPMPLVSISVNQTVPLRDVLFELAKQANYDIELDPRITGSIIFTARNQPFDLVVQRICDTAGLRYKFDNNVLRVEIDSPYHETYKIDYLSYVRKSSSSINNNVSLAQAAGGSSGGAAAGSQFQAASESEANFWGELQTNLQQIMGVPVGAGEMRTDSDPQITATAANPAPVAPVITRDPSGKPTNVQVQAPQATLQVNSLPATGGGAAAPAASASTIPSFSINKQAGIISVYANEHQQAQLRDYLKLLRRAVTAQVLIEAKVLEVDLTDEFSAGVDWGTVAQALHGRYNLSLGNFSAPALAPAATGSIALLDTHSTGAEVADIVSAVQRFGTVKALSSPRLTVLNNQAAVLNVASNQVYFSLQVNSTTDNGVTQTTVNSTAHNVPEGVLINVQPSIDLDNKSISLSVRPTVTRIIGEVADPAVAFLNVPGVVSNVPVVNVQEMDSVINVGSGQAVLMGGLMQDRTDSTQQGIPVLSEIPMIGAAFRSQGDKVAKSELIIFLRASIVDDVGSPPDDADRDIYNGFSGDRHPMKL